MNEPNHPSLKKYQHEHTKQWSAKIDEADAFIFVTAEYDYNYLRLYGMHWNICRRNGHTRLLALLVTAVFLAAQEL
jgi:hypothetical protein